MNKTVNLFVLAGCWECPDDIGVTVVAISSDEKQLIDRLDQIADTQAKEYVSIEGSILMEEHTDTRYEISGGISGNARFYITELYEFCIGLVVLMMVLGIAPSG